MTERPAIGQLVKLRGREPSGTLVRHNPATDWCEVAWSDNGPHGPRIVHINELERVLQ